MRNVSTLAVALMLLSAAKVSDAGTSGTGGSPTASRSAGSMSRSAGTSRPTTYRPAVSSLARDSTPGARALGSRRSLLQGGAQPSAKLTHIIRERESSGPGWLGTAFLVALLSRHDLSDSDRRWLQTKIDALADDDQADDQSELSPPRVPTVAFLYAGLQGDFTTGRAYTVQVTAHGAHGNPVAVICSMPEARIVTEGPGAAILWEPRAPAVYVLTCQAGGLRDRRLLKAG